MKEGQYLPHISGEALPLFRSHLLHWYEINQRELPWRGTKNPYLIWVSEIILQQTQVVQGWDYYLRFTEKYPDIPSLANADEEELLLLWQGLGYYSRAHNMLQAARQMMQCHGGIFPKNEKEVSALKGIGPYTTAAIMSIAYDAPLAVVDGNVYRILSRLEASSTPIDTPQGQKVYRALAQAYLDHEQPGKYNQAMMDLGATICTPHNPKCTDCPIARYCITYKQPLLAELLPIKAKKTKVVDRYLDYFLLLQDDTFYVVQRDRRSIWKGLYQLPLIESAKQYASEDELQEAIHGEWHIAESRELKTHRLTHRLLHIRIHICTPIDTPQPLPSPYIRIPISSHSEYAFPKPLRHFLDKFF